jgi:hypothetical protein
MGFSWRDAKPDAMNFFVAAASTPPQPQAQPTPLQQPTTISKYYKSTIPAWPGFCVNWLDAHSTRPRKTPLETQQALVSLTPKATPQRRGAL